MMKSLRNFLIKWKSLYLDVLFFEMIMLLITALLIKPILSFLLSFMLQISGYQLVFNSFILGFFLSVPGIIAGIALLIFAVFFTLFEYSVIMILCQSRLQGEYILLRQAVFMAAGRLRKIKYRYIPGMAFFLLLFIPLINSGTSGTLLPQVEIPNFVTGELLKHSWGNLLLIFLYILLFAMFLLTIWVLPVMVLERQGLLGALKKNKQLLCDFKGKTCGVIAVFTACKLLLAGISGILTAPVFYYSLTDIKRIYAVYGLSAETLMLVSVLLLTSIISIAVKPIMLLYLTSQYCGIQRVRSVRDMHKSESDIYESRYPGMKKYLAVFKKSGPIRKWYFGFAGIVLIGIGYFVFYNAPDLHEPVVIGHRGSDKGVENTYEAIQGAVDAGADYAEIDVYLSADGIPVVSHDANLKRLTGENLNVADLTAAELQELTLRQGELTGKIKTLDDTLKFFEDKIKIAIELKLHGSEQEDLVTETLAVVQENDALDRVIFLSLEYELVEAVKNQSPEAIAGYCVYRNVGALQSQILMSMNLDFIVIEEAMADSRTIYNFRKAWIPVYVWTVNDAHAMQRYLEMGAAGIVSDDPALAREMLDIHLQVSKRAYLSPEEWR